MPSLEQHSVEKSFHLFSVSLDGLGWTRAGEEVVGPDLQCLGEPLQQVNAWSGSPASSFEMYERVTLARSARSRCVIWREARMDRRRSAKASTIEACFIRLFRLGMRHPTFGFGKVG